MDLALLSPDPAQSPRFLAFSGNFDAWRCSDGGSSSDSARSRAYDQLGSGPVTYDGGGYAFTAERIFVTDAPWPSKAVLPPPSYLLRAGGGLVVAVPLHVGERTPMSPRTDPVILMNVIATPDDEASGRVLVATLGVRAFLGRVHHILDSSVGLSGETGSLQWRARS
jgi:hypothetical protein